jgi:hypothetical protein
MVCFVLQWVFVLNYSPRQVDNGGTYVFTNSNRYYYYAILNYNCQWRELFLVLVLFLVFVPVQFH